MPTNKIKAKLMTEREKQINPHNHEPSTHQDFFQKAIIAANNADKELQETNFDNFPEE